MADLTDLKGLLVDLDGTLYVGDDVISGAVAALESLRDAGFLIRGVTNTTTKSVRSLAARLDALGIPIKEDELLSPPRIAVRHLESMRDPKVRLILRDDPATEFAAFDVDDEAPDVIVIGDIGPVWNYELLSSLFGQLVNGASLIALHKGRFYQGPDGLVLDIGAFVSALEFSSGVEAKVVGKPSPEFFHLACSTMGLDPGRVAMVGDDVDSDVGGAQRAGLAGILVRTGKYRPHLVDKSGVRPDTIVASIADVPSLLAASLR